MTGVKESVCQKLLKATEGMDVILANLDGSDFAEADCGDGSFLITYSNDLGKGGEGGGTETNCWETGTCKESDKTEEYEAYCEDGLHHKGYFECLEQIGTEDEWTDYEGCVDSYGYYDSCRANGNSSLFCECATIDYYDLEDVFEFCTGYESCVSQGTSKNCCECQGFGEPEETCIEIGDCP